MSTAWQEPSSVALAQGVCFPRALDGWNCTQVMDGLTFYLIWQTNVFKVNVLGIIFKTEN